MKKTFEDYWLSLMQKNPSLSDSIRMTITIDAFKAAIRKAYEAGHQNGYESSSSMFERIFGK